MQMELLSVPLVVWMVGLVAISLGLGFAWGATWSRIRAGRRPPDRAARERL